jgi:uncharacterized RDD family membrane protein YckC
MVHRFLTGLILFLGVTASLWAQGSVEAELSSRSILMGDQVNYQIRVSHPATATVEIDLAPLADVEGLEIVREGPAVTREDAGTGYLEKNIVLTSFDSGTYTIPQIPVHLIRANGEVDQLETMSVILTVAGIPIATDSLQLAPIKDIVYEPFNFWDGLPYLIGLVLLAAIIATIWWFYVRKTEPDQELVPTAYRTLHDLSLEKLTKLEHRQLWQKGEVKEYYSRLTYIIREYLEHRYHIPAMEYTSTEILSALQRRGDVNAETLQRLRHILSASDMVKFAKAKPASAFHTEALDTSRSFVGETKDAESAPVPVMSQKELPKGSVAAADGAAFTGDGDDLVILPEELLERRSRVVIKPADFWERFFARFFDVVLVSVITVMPAVLGWAAIMRDDVDGFLLPDTNVIILAGLITGVVWLLYLWIFFAFVNYRLGAGPGKLILQIREVDLEDQPMNLSIATKRFFGKLLTEVLAGIGYLTYFVNKDRRSLPDLIAGTKVIKGRPVRMAANEFGQSTVLVNTHRAELAGFWRRFFARVIDLNLWALLFIAYIFLLGWGMDDAGLLQGESSGWLNVVLYALFILFFFAYWPWMTSRFGGTMGKLLLKIQIVDLEGNFVSMKTAGIRFLGFIIAESLWGLGYITYFWDKEFRQSLPDILANTMVINKPKHNEQVILDHFEE